MRSWGKKVIDDVEYDLTHLDSAVIDVSAKTEASVSFRVLVSYGHHCFARDVRTGDPDHHIFEVGSDRRCFCPVRAALSKELPRLVREASAGMAFFSEGRNMLIVDDVPGGPYAVFFNVEQAQQASLDVILFVASAYLKPELPDRLHAVPFTALIQKASNGHKPFRPTKTKAWKKKIAPELSGAILCENPLCIR
ncbi:hypothetical protein [Bradyrhizobium erythrophlei]|uniref:Uncharacterized protein n=1 Tax=Bradyrhizobium erythrophlei TaxID=1437360 RepID=A0A1M5JR11_9BRAD|nr:hypothetical protein [Bradyrhizobium erythrophlei]SHG43022.1 hypothetical protein SAMN05443248_1536 [Bradyrhizobium erythrophlei]